MRAVRTPPTTAADGPGERADLTEVIRHNGLFVVRARVGAPAAGVANAGDLLILRPLTGREDGWSAVAAEVVGVLGLYTYVPQRASPTRPSADAFRLLPLATGTGPVTGPVHGVRILGVVVGVLRTST